MKVGVLTVAIGLASTVLATSSGIAGGPSCPQRPERRNPALLTIRALHIFNKPIRAGSCNLAKGPIWDPGYPVRPGQGMTMVIDAHDVTPVPGYGAHGPFYNLYRIRPGYLAKIKWKGVWRTYRFVMKPTPRTQKHPIVKTSFRVESVWFRCCWPRYTKNDFLYERAVLVRPRNH